MADAVLTLNAGSSSIKFSLFEVDGASSLRLASQGEVEGIGSAPHFSVRDKAGTILADQTWPAPHQAFESLLEGVIGWTETHLREDSLIAVGHRVVHGGPDHYRPELATPDLLAALDRLTPLASVARASQRRTNSGDRRLPAKLPQVACFDTAFHHTMPAVATRFRVAARILRMRACGAMAFHGLSL